MCRPCLPPPSSQILRDALRRREPTPALTKVREYDFLPQKIDRNTARFRKLPHHFRCEGFEWSPEPSANLCTAARSRYKWFCSQCVGYDRKQTLMYVIPAAEWYVP